MVWIPLSAGDPLPGEPDGLAQLAALLQREADDMRDALARLRAVNSSEFWEGEAATTFADARGRVAPDLELVIGRIQLSADALRGFVPAMGDCQHRARVAVNRAREAEATLARAQAGLADAIRQGIIDQAAADAAAEANPDVPPPMPPPDPLPGWRNLIEEAQRERDHAARLFAEAVEDYEDAADRCADLLQPAISDRLRNHHRGFLGRIAHAVVEGVEDAGGALIDAGEAFGERVANAGETLIDAGEAFGERVADAGETLIDAGESFADTAIDVAGFVGEHLDVVSEGLGLAAMVTGFIPGLQTVSLGLAGVKTALDVGLALAGPGDWKSVRDDMIGFALFGAGRALTGVARAKTGMAAAEKAAEQAAKLQSLRSETLEGDQLVQRTRQITDLSRRLRSTNEVRAKFAQDAARPLVRQTVEMMRHLETKLPNLRSLSLSRGAMFSAGAVRGIEVYDHYQHAQKVHEIFDKYEPLVFVAESRPAP